MQKYTQLLKTITKKNYIPILQNTLCNSEGIFVSDKNIFLHIKTDMFTDTKIRDFNGTELGMNPSDFIAMPDFGAYQGLVMLNTKKLICILKKSSAYIEKGKDVRPFLKGVWITTDSNKVLISASDAQKAVQHSLGDLLGSDNLDIFIPQKLMSVITKLEKYSVDITVTKFENVIRLETGNITVVYNPAENFNNVVKNAFRNIPDERITKITLEKKTTLSILNELKKEIHDCIDACPYFKEARKNKIKQDIHINWLDNNIKYDYSSEYNNVKSFIKNIPCEGNIKGVVKLNDLIHIINDIDSDIINLNVSDAGVIKNQEDNKKLALLLKMG